MKKLFLLAVLTLALAAGSAFAAQSSSMHVRTYIDNCGKHVRHPRMLVISCADHNYYLGSLAWKRWGRRSSTATGISHVNDCKPNCASGKFKSYPVTAKASRRMRCHGHRDYTKLRITYTKAQPKGIPNPDIIKLNCV